MYVLSCPLLSKYFACSVCSKVLIYCMRDDNIRKTYFFYVIQSVLSLLMYADGITIDVCLRKYSPVHFSYSAWLSSEFLFRSSLLYNCSAYCYFLLSLLATSLRTFSISHNFSAILALLSTCVSICNVIIEPSFIILLSLCADGILAAYWHCMFWIRVFLWGWHAKTESWCVSTHYRTPPVQDYHAW